MASQASASGYENLIPAEIKDDELYQAIQEIVWQESITTVLEIGSSSGTGSTAAFVAGMRQNPSNPTLFCIEVSKPRFAELQRQYANDAFVKCYNVSSVELAAFPDEAAVIEFYNHHSTNLNLYSLEQVLVWLHENIGYIRNADVPEAGIKIIKQENSIDYFDVVLIDGSEFTGVAELEEIYGAKYIMLDDICTFKNYQNHQKLADDANYALIHHNPNVRHGYSIFQKISVDIPAHFLTIVLNGEPFIRYHIEVFKQLAFSWHWHIIEGVADLKHDTAWSVNRGGKVTDAVHHNGLSNDGTTAYLDSLKQLYPENITLYRQANGAFWDGKQEMVNAPLVAIAQECLLWQIDVDELWTVEQLTKGWQMFVDRPDKTAAYYWCWYFVGEHLVISSRYCYAQNPQQDWLRTWRFKPGCVWATHEPPRLMEPLPDGQWRDLAAMNPFLHDETEQQQLVFQHFAYVTADQLRFKEQYYGYTHALSQWTALQEQTRFPTRLRQYFPWVRDLTTVDTAEAMGIVPIAHRHQETWQFRAAEELHTSPPPNPVPLIVVDGIFFQLNKTGIARVWQSLLQAWVSSGFSQHLLVLDRAGTAPDISGIRYVTIAPYHASASDREMLQQVCDQVGADLFISTYFTTPLTTPSVLMVYDMIPEVMGESANHPIVQSKRQAIESASDYLAISQNTARDLERFFPELNHAVKVAYCGVEPVFSPAAPAAVAQFKAKYGITKPYFLVMSADNPSPYKNNQLFFRAFAQLAAKTGFDLVCTAIAAALPEDLRDYTTGSTVHLLRLTDAELAVAYSGAIALVYPSRYEGFGMPVLEAMACGCPVITCANASIPEVAGTAVLYVADDSVEDLADALCEVQKPSIRSTLIAAGLAQAQQFSWAAMAATVGSVLVEATLPPLNLRSINLIVFPDWNVPESLLYEALAPLLAAILTHPDQNLMTLLIDTSDVPHGSDPHLILGDIVMNFLMQTELAADEPELALVGDLSQVQWQALMRQIHGLIVLETAEATRAQVMIEDFEITSLAIADLADRRAMQLAQGWELR